MQHWEVFPNQAIFLSLEIQGDEIFLIFDQFHSLLLCFVLVIFEEGFGEKKKKEKERRRVGNNRRGIKNKRRKLKEGTKNNKKINK